MKHRDSKKEPKSYDWARQSNGQIDKSDTERKN